jgi:hypothetical protein
LVGVEAAAVDPILFLAALVAFAGVVAAAVLGVVFVVVMARAPCSDRRGSASDE